ncbi:MAG: hypothetical protein KDD73_04640, partial [Anaerolineales bacterium]|nr:hypothetical protein [Anaerolineales bacterium]
HGLPCPTARSAVPDRTACRARPHGPPCPTARAAVPDHTACRARPHGTTHIPTIHTNDTD